MRKGLFVIGLVLLIIGVAAAGLTFQQSTSVSVPQAPNASVVTLGSVTAGTMKVSWTGGAASTYVNVSECSDSSCLSFSNLVGSGQGGSGSFSFSVAGGATYAIYANTGGVSATVQIDGFVPLTFIGVVLAAIGAFLLVVGILARPKVRAAPSEVAPPMAPTGLMGNPQEAPAPSAAPAGDQGHIMQAPVQAAQPTAAPGQMVKCASCGTLNEMWLHNCRWCKRPLTSTSGEGAVA
jgi:hypothetical protein